MDNEIENRRFVERREHFRGSAKVHLQYLRFEQQIDVPSQAVFLDQKNVARLEKIFDIEGCLRLDPEHRIPVLIDEKDLEASLQRANLASAELFTSKVPPTLPFSAGYGLRCLHGRHRIAAAQKFLLAGDKWWTVDLYSEKLNQSLRRDLREEYSNSRNFCDGDIYQQIRACQKNQDLLGEGRWLARLTEGKRKDFKQLHTRKELKRLAEALDKLLPYVGFWPSLQIGTFHRVLNLKCPEELTHYLTHIESYWDQIIGGDPTLRPLIDYGTVRRLQMRNPWASRMDNDFLVEAMEQQTLFPFILSTDLRTRIKRNLLNRKCLIPSLYTFFEDTKWLEPCAKVMRKLLPSGCRMSTRKSLLSNFDGSRYDAGKTVVQTDHKAAQNWEGTEQEIVDCSYRQLWLFAWRHFPELSALLPRRDQGHAKPKAQASSEQTWQSFANTAYWLGFDSDCITQLRARDADYEMAKAFLSQVRPSEFYWLSDRDRADTVREICKVLSSIEEETTNTDTSPPDFEAEVVIDNRCGRPFEQSYKYTRTHFFLPEVYAAKERKVTHFSVNQDIFFAFFGAESPYKSEHGDPNSKATNSETERRPNQDRHIQREDAARRHQKKMKQREAATERQADGGQTAGEATGQTALESSHVHHIEEVTAGQADTIMQSQAEQQVVQTQVAAESQSSGAQESSHTHQNKQMTVIQPRAEQQVVLFQAATESQSSETQLTSYINPDLEHSELYTNWKLLKEGDVLLVSLAEATFSWIRAKQANSLKPPWEVICIADQAFAWFNPDRKQFKIIDPEDVVKYGKNSQYDGVIYYHPKHYPAGNGTYMNVAGAIEPLIGVTTKSRLYEIEQKCTKKKRGRTGQHKKGEPSQKRQDAREIRSIYQGGLGTKGQPF